MFLKKIGKKALAFVLAGCMVVPTLSYMGVWKSLGNMMSADAAESYTVEVQYTKVGNFYKGTYFLKDSSGNLITMEEAKNNPATATYYTRFHKAQYYTNGNGKYNYVTSSGTDTGKTSNVGYVMERYTDDTATIRKESLKINPGAQIGSDENPFVVVEIVPDELSTAFSYMHKGQEPYDMIAACMLTAKDGSTFSSIKPHNFFNFETVAGGQTGIVYGTQDFAKVVLGLGYHKQEVAQAPEIDKYTFVDWYVSTSDTFDPSVFSDSNRVLGGGWKPSPFSAATTATQDLHLYARWTAESYSTSSGTMSVDASGNVTTNPVKTIGKIDTAVNTDYVSDPTGSGVEGKYRKTVTSQGEKDTVTVKIFNNTYEFNSVTFHYCLPTNPGGAESVAVDVDEDGKIGENEGKKDVDLDGLKGEYEFIDYRPYADVSFADDYNFDGLIDLTYLAWDFNTNTFYPSLMGNTDYNILTTNKGNVQVVPIPTSEFKAALSNGQTERYQHILDNADFIYVSNSQYGNNNYVTDVKQLATRAASTIDRQKDQYLNLFNEHTSGTLESFIIDGNTLVDSTKIKMEAMDLEAYAVLRLMENMAMVRGKKIPVYMDFVAMGGYSQGGSISNLAKLGIFGLMNDDVTITYNAWHKKNLVEIVSQDDPVAAAYKAKNYLASSNTLIIKDEFAVAGSTAHKSASWSVINMLPLKDYNTGKRVLNEGTYQITRTDPNDESKVVTVNAGLNLSSSLFDMYNSHPDKIDLKSEGWRADSASGANSSLSNYFMLYNGNNSLMSSFLQTGEYNASNYMTNAGYQFLFADGALRAGAQHITTGMALRSLIQSYGTSSVEIIIDNKTSTGNIEVTNSADVSQTVTIPVDYIEGMEGAGTQKIVYHLSEGDSFDLEYYQVNNYKDTLENTLATGNATRITLSESLTAGTVTYAATPMYEAQKDATNNDIIRSVNASGQVSIPDGTDLSMFYVNTIGLTPASEGNKYVICDADHKIWRYVTVKVTNMPFTLD